METSPPSSTSRLLRRGVSIAGRLRSIHTWFSPETFSVQTFVEPTTMGDKTFRSIVGIWSLVCAPTGGSAEQISGYQALLVASIVRRSGVVP